MIRRIKLAIKVLLGKTVAARLVTIFPDDLFIVSYPRSGNTWIRFLVGNLIDREEPVTFANIEQKIPDIYQNSDQVLQSLPRPRILKSHEYLDPRYPKLIYIVRDPRDVAVSYYHYHLKIRRFDDKYPIDRYISTFVSGKLDRFGSWREHVGGWLGARGNTPSFLLIRYEDLLERSAQELERIASFIGIHATEEQLERALQMSSAVNMRKLEKTQTKLWRPIRESRKDKLFIRSAKSGEWKRELSHASVMKIESAWGDQMRSLGYRLAS